MSENHPILQAFYHKKQHQLGYSSTINYKYKHKETTYITNNKDQPYICQAVTDISSSMHKNTYKQIVMSFNQNKEKKLIQQ